MTLGSGIDFATHERVLKEGFESSTGALRETYWDLFEGMSWLKALAHHGLILSIADPDLKHISASIARYRAWASSLAQKGRGQGAAD
jgi:hypothetical protein